MRKLIFGLVAATWMTLSTTLYAALDMNAGLWETTTTMTGQKAGVEQKCFLQKDIDDLENTVKGVAGKANQPCSYADYKESGNTLSLTG